MDIAGISMALAANATQTDVGTAVLSKVLDSEEDKGTQIVQMIDAAAIERSVNPAVGSNMDIRI